MNQIFSSSKVPHKYLYVASFKLTPQNEDRKEESEEDPLDSLSPILLP